MLQTPKHQTSNPQPAKPLLSSHCEPYQHHLQQGRARASGPTLTIQHAPTLQVMLDQPHHRNRASHKTTG